MAWKGLKYFVKGAGIDDWFKAWGSWWRLLVTFLAVVFLALVLYGSWSWWTKKKPQNVSNPKVVAMPGSHIEKIEQPTTQVYVEPEKKWEVGLGAGVASFDSKNGAGAWCWVKKKW